MARDYVLIWGRFELPDKNALAHRVRANAKMFQKLGYDVVLIGYVRNQEHKIEEGVTSEYRYYNMPYPSGLADWFSDFKAYRFIEHVVEKLGKEYCKIIVFTGVGTWNTAGLVRMSKRESIPIISDTVDWLIYNRGNPFYRLFKTIDEFITVDLIKPRVKNIICISSYLSNYYKSKKCNTVVIPSLTISEDERFSNLPQYQPEEYVHFCYAGSPGKRGSKDRIDWCVIAVIQCDEHATLDIYGLTEESFVIDYPEMIQKIDRNRIKFRGRQSNYACINAIASADYFIFAREDNRTTRAGFPTKFSESLAIGTPVVTTPSGDITEFLQNGINGYIAESCTYDSFYEAISRAVKTSSKVRCEQHCRVKSDQLLDCSHWINTLGDYLNIIGIK